ncbi:MAG: hypothetical protein LUG95_02140 [Clostridiales bacterium]|nr:hypothetical protein [Clostridiales bacterium]
MLNPDLVETHCHIIPGIDDGSPDVETSIKMLNALKRQGAKAVILTPHYYSDSISMDDFVKRRDNAFNELLSALPPDMPKLIPAAEVYISKYLFTNDNLDKISIGNSGYILIEHPFSCDFSQRYYERLLNLNYEYGLKPILAHIERYPALMENEDLLDAYIDMGCLVQVNISSFANSHRSMKKKLFKYLDNGKIHLTGSDSHNLDTRPPEYADGTKEIIKRSRREAIRLLEHNANVLVK